MRDQETSSLATGWLEVIGSHAVRGELEDVYARLSDEVAERRPVCDASGRCCNFEAWGHRLYVTGLEAAYTVSRLRAAPADAHGHVERTESISLPQLNDTPVELSAATLEAARQRGGCPFQVGRFCGAHAIRPLGCRVYYCDPAAQDWQQDLSERLLAEIRAIHNRHRVEYRYGEWRDMLGMFLGTGGR